MTILFAPGAPVGETVEKNNAPALTEISPEFNAIPPSAVMPPEDTVMPPPTVAIPEDEILKPGTLGMSYHPFLMKYFMYNKMN